MIVDDEEAILTLLTAVLNKEGFNNIKAINDSISSIKVCKSYKPDIIILDIMMPTMSGFEVFSEIRKFTDVPILFLSAKSDEVDKILGLGFGADDYITKPFSPKEVAFRIKAHLRIVERIKESLNNDDEKLHTKDFTIDFKNGEITKGNNTYELRAKELKLIKLLVTNKNNILPKDMIIEKVWGESFDGYDNTLMVHIRKLREKLENDPSAPNYIKTVKGIGYKFSI
nr:response regulator transcription factor [Clostridium cavendishii]